MFYCIAHDTTLIGSFLNNLFSLGIPFQLSRILGSDTEDTAKLKKSFSPFSSLSTSNWTSEEDTIVLSEIGMVL